MYVLIVYVVLSGVVQIFSIQGQFSVGECQSRAATAMEEARRTYPGSQVNHQCTPMARG